MAKQDYNNTKIYRYLIDIQKVLFERYKHASRATRDFMFTPLQVLVTSSIQLFGDVYSFDYDDPIATIKDLKKILNNVFAIQSHIQLLCEVGQMPISLTHRLTDEVVKELKAEVERFIEYKERQLVPAKTATQERS